MKQFVIKGVGGITNSLYDKSDKIKKVRDEYEHKISNMQKELRKLQSAQKEHTRQQRELQSQESQLRNLKNELFEMKSAKVRDKIVQSRKIKMLNKLSNFR